MNNPYDIYSGGGREPGLLGRFFESPATAIGWMATDLFITPRLTNHRGLMNTMLQDKELGWSKWRNFRNAAKAQFGGTDPGSLRAMMLGGEFAGPHGRGTFGNHHNAIRTYGRKAGNRIGLARTLSGFSRFGVYYSLLHLGVGLAQGYIDMVTAFDPEDQKKKRPSRDLETGGAFVDTRFAQTQRQRAIQAIHNTHLSTRAALGNEAHHLHFAR